MLSFRSKGGPGNDATWPVTLPGDVVSLRPLRRRDEAAWLSIRRTNHAWLVPWEATAPPGALPGPATFVEYAKVMEREARQGRTLPWVMEVDGQFAGQLTVSSITFGSLCSASVGYWIAQEYAGRSITPTAVAMAVRYCIESVGLHRVEIAIRPENAASLRVAAKLGLREEGLRPRYLHIAGAWADHRVFAITAEELPGSTLMEWTQPPKSH